jgi:hypothetical protein
MEKKSERLIAKVRCHKSQKQTRLHTRKAKAARQVMINRTESVLKGKEKASKN